MAINGYGCYVKYTALKSHFTSRTYDYFKYHGQTRTSVTTYESRPDRYFFERLAKNLKTNENIEVFFVSNFICRGAVWIGDTLTDDHFIAHNKYIGVLQNFSYHFEEDLQTIKECLEIKKNIV